MIHLSKIMIVTIGINMKTKIIITLIFSLLIIFNANAQVDKFERRVHKNLTIYSKNIPYRLFIPDNYDPNKKYPLVLFLHGAGERGIDNQSQITSSKGALLWASEANQKDHPCFIVAPQCPDGDQWVNTSWGLGSYSTTKIPISKALKMVVNLLDTLKANYSLDTTSFYVTGLSMGGYGTWDIITRFPQMFRAAIPICGAGDPSKAKLLAKTPIWCFHSADDNTVPVKGTREMVNAINEQGVNNRDNFYTEYTNAGHFAWVPAYSEPDLVAWLFNTVPVQYIPDVTLPDAPIDLTANEITKTTLKLTWKSQSSDAYYYKIYNNGIFLDSIISETNKKLSNLKSGTSYTLMVSTVDWAGNESVNNTIIVVSTLNATSANNYQKVDDKLIIAPNPSNGIITLSEITINDGATVEIYSPDGRLAFKKSFETIDDKVVIDLTVNSPRLYHIVLFKKDEIFRKGTFVLL